MPSHNLHPEGWQIKTLGKLARYINGRAFKPTDWSHVGLPIIRIEQINNAGADYDYFNGEVASNHLIDDGDLLFSWSATLAVLIWNRGPAVLNQHIFKVVPTRETDIHFLYHLLDFSIEALATHTHGSTMKHIKNTDLFPFPVLVPSPTEQRHIADILDTIDAQIQYTEQLIAKLKLQKAGLLHDLLTRGLDEQGKLRDPVAQPEQFKDAVLGKKLVKIPKEWEITTLGSVILPNGGLIQTGPFGSQLHANEYVPEGVPVIMPQDILSEHISQSQIAHIMSSKSERLAKHRVEFNDVVFARRGDLERCAFIDVSEVGWICGTGCLLVRPPKSLIDGRWLATIYRHNYSQQQIRERAVGSTMVNLNTGLLANLVIAVPTPTEQVAIVDCFSSLDTTIRIEEAHRDKLKLYKKGLMHNLLTGRVRVDVTDEEGEVVDIK